MYRIEETRGVYGEPTRPKDSTRLLHCPAGIGEVFKHLVADHSVEGLR